MIQTLIDIRISAVINKNLKIIDDKIFTSVNVTQHSMRPITLNKCVFDDTHFSQLTHVKL